MKILQHKIGLNTVGTAGTLQPYFTVFIGSAGFAGHITVTAAYNGSGTLIKVKFVVFNSKQGRYGSVLIFSDRF